MICEIKRYLQHKHNLTQKNPSANLFSSSIIFDCSSVKSFVTWKNPRCSSTDLPLMDAAILRVAKSVNCGSPSCTPPNAISKRSFGSLSWRKVMNFSLVIDPEMSSDVNVGSISGNSPSSFTCSRYAETHSMHYLLTLDTGRASSAPDSSIKPFRTEQ